VINSKDVRLMATRAMMSEKIFDVHLEELLKRLKMKAGIQLNNF
jgi:hypothetical protein